MQRLQSFFTNFLNPTLVFLGILLYGVFTLLHFPLLALIAIFGAIILGSYSLVLKTFSELMKKHFALDYIALLAIVVSVLSGEYLVAAIIALMISSGATLEEYGAKQARKSLTSLIDRIPSDVIVWQKNTPRKTIPLSQVSVGQHIFIRKGEVIPLDGTLLSEHALTDESSLTGEPYLMEKEKGDIMRSGTINIGSPIVIEVTKEEKDSTYRKIITMVQQAQTEKAPLIRLADRYSTFFTIITAIIATFAYFNLGGLHGALAVLVIATPCPLIIATPIALLGGVNAAAKKRIIIKKLAVLETLQRVDTIVFDKTGTLTFGQPQLVSITPVATKLTNRDLLAIASALERNSLHPLAKAIVQAAKDNHAPHLSASNISEEIGKGISGTIDKHHYVLRKVATPSTSGMQIELVKDTKQIAIFSFADILKTDTKPILERLKKLGYRLLIFTGDKKSSAEHIGSQLGTAVEVHAEMKPEDKQQGVINLKKQHHTIAMIGDGINDAPALATSDVGMVFSSEEQTAASEAADVVLLGGDFALAAEAISIAKRTISIALQSILAGIGISILGMILASFGLIPPLLGAGLQEAIDVAVIINALRASRV